eukprot:6076170-Prymnesium_polylepis.1
MGHGVYSQRLHPGGGMGATPGVCVFTPFLAVVPRFPLRCLPRPRLSSTEKAPPWFQPPGTSSPRKAMSTDADAAELIAANEVLYVSCGEDFNLPVPDAAQPRSVIEPMPAAAEQPAAATEPLHPPATEPAP